MTMLPWSKAEAWPTFGERTSAESSKAFEVPEWASRLAGLGHWMVSSGEAGRFHRGVVIVPIRQTAVAWLVLGALMAGFSHPNHREVEVGDTVWFPPKPGRKRFGNGTVVGLPAGDMHGLFRIERLDDRTIDSCGRDAFFVVEGTPKLDSALTAEKAVAFARMLGVQCTSARCLVLEDLIGITGGKDQVKSAAEGIELGGATLYDLMMLEEKGFSMCRHLGDRRAKPNDKVRLVVIDGPNGLNLLEDEDFGTADTPAIAILTPDEWISGQPDSDRIDNALVDWQGELCGQWPQGLEMPGLGCLLYRRNSSR